MWKYLSGLRPRWPLYFFGHLFRRMGREATFLTHRIRDGGGFGVAGVA